MMRAVMESAGLTFWPIFSLILFSLFCAALCAWLYRRGSGDFYQGMARLALEQGGAEASQAGRENGRQG